MPDSCNGFRIPQPTDYSIPNTLKTLTWSQFPAIMDKSIEYFGVLPSTGRYRQVRSEIKSFMDGLHDVNSRQYTLSGIGSLIDYHTFGHQIKRPSPQLQGTGCNANSLCIEPTCFNFTEGVIENNNMLMNMCWSLSMPCLKDFYYSDRKFEDKIRQYFAMFFMQAPAVLEAFQRTNLIENSIKVVATNQNFTYTGPVIGGGSGISLPFYMDPTDSISFPDIDSIPGGIGGFNLMAFVNFLAPRLFGDSFTNGMEDVTVYGLNQDFMTAKDQTASVMDSYMDMEIIRAIQMRGGMSSMDRIGQIIGGNFVHDPMFPTFGLDASNILYPIAQEILEPSTIAGYVQTGNPEHALAKYRSLLFVRNNWKYSLVEAPEDDFTMLGLDGLNFGLNTPGVQRIMSSRMFRNNQVGPDGIVRLGMGMGPGGLMEPVARGLVPRGERLQEAVRTDLLLTYSNIECNGAIDGQLPTVAQQMTPQSVADGFRLKSTMFIGSDVRGTSKPVLVTFQTDTPRSASPIIICNTNEVVVDQSGGVSIVSCCPGGQIYTVLTFTGDVSSDFTVGDTAVFRTGARGTSYLVDVTAVSGNVVTVQSQDGETLIDCCSGSPDDYGTRSTLVNTTGIVATSAEIMKSSCDTGTLSLELFTPIANALDGAGATITLANGNVIAVETSGDSTGVFVDVVVAGGETCDLCADITCNCLLNAVFTLS